VYIYNLRVRPLGQSELLKVSFHIISIPDTIIGTTVCVWQRLKNYTKCSVFCNRVCPKDNIAFWKTISIWIWWK